MYIWPFIRVRYLVLTALNISEITFFRCFSITFQPIILVPSPAIPACPCSSLEVALLAISATNLIHLKNVELILPPFGGLCLILNGHTKTKFFKSLRRKYVEQNDLQNCFLTACHPCEDSNMSAVHWLHSTVEQKLKTCLV